FIFKPCIRAVNLSTAGRITGFVADTTDALLPDAKVWIEQDSVIATAYTDSLGHYAFIGVPSGTFSMYATKENYDTSGFDDINVISGNSTIQNFILIKKE
ncbi:MAG: carboxypeptidase-like regulatory domain-containing protein, partial [Methanococcaceae archaeon]